VIFTGRLKAWLLGKENKVVARKRQYKHVSGATNNQAAVEKLLELAFLTQLKKNIFFKCQGSCRQDELIGGKSLVVK
jgi:hypothetical protein